MKTSIQSLEEYAKICQLVQESHERMNGGEGETGIHYRLHWILNSYSIRATTPAEAISRGRQLLREYEREIR